MAFTQNLLYLLLLFAVLDHGNKLTVTSGILIAIGIILFGFCCDPRLVCCNDDRRRFNNNGFATVNGL